MTGLRVDTLLDEAIGRIEVQAGNAHYRLDTDLPSTIPIFPLEGALLLPGGRMPLNIFEPRYLQMVDEAIAGSRLIGIIQPSLDGALRADGEPELCSVGCAGRIISLAESGDGRYLISLQGVCRFRIAHELTVKTPFRQCKLAPFLTDLDEDQAANEIDRPALLKAFRAYLQAHDLEADWESVSRAENAMLVNALSMMAPYGPAEKQALLEAADLKMRAETLIAITEMALARENEDFGSSLQ
jgi:Lon protease-like protein